MEKKKLFALGIIIVAIILFIVKTAKRKIEKVGQTIRDTISAKYPSFYARGEFLQAVESAFVPDGYEAVFINSMRQYRDQYCPSEPRGAECGVYRNTIRIMRVHMFNPSIRELLDKVR